MRMAPASSTAYPIWVGFAGADYLSYRTVTARYPGEPTYRPGLNVRFPRQRAVTVLSIGRSKRKSP